MKTKALSLLALTLAVSASVAPAENPPPDRIAVVPDSIAWMSGPPSLPPGAKSAVLEGDPTKPGLFTMRVQLPANYVIAPHRHPEAERVTVLAGSIFVGFGEEVQREGWPRFPAGGFYVNPAGAPHFVWTDEPVTLQITGMGPWQLHYADPKDDPRTAKKP